MVIAVVCDRHEISPRGWGSISVIKIPEGLFPSFTSAKRCVKRWWTFNPSPASPTKEEIVRSCWGVRIRGSRIPARRITSVVAHLGRTDWIPEGGRRESTPLFSQSAASGVVFDVLSCGKALRCYISNLGIPTRGLSAPSLLTRKHHLIHSQKSKGRAPH